MCVSYTATVNIAKDTSGATYMVYNGVLRVLDAKDLLRRYSDSNRSQIMEVVLKIVTTTASTTTVGQTSAAERSESSLTTPQ